MTRPRSPMRTAERPCGPSSAAVSSRWRGLLVLLPALAIALAVVRPAPPAIHAAESVTWSRQIAPIVYANCAQCHHAGGSGPFALTSYAEARRWGGVMEQVTQSRYMPPWLPVPGHGDFAGDRRLSDEQIALIKAWAAAGMPEGNPAEAPEVPVFTSDWALGKPDLIVEVDSPMLVPAGGTDLFRNFILPVPITSTKWVRAMEIKPGAPRVVHHANLLVDRTASLRRAHPHDWQQGVPGMDVTVDSGESFDPDSHFLDWKPDSAALVEAPGMPWRLDPGNDLVLNMHLKPTGKPESVRARVGLYFTDQPATKLPMLLQLEHDDALDIPAGDAGFVVSDEMTLPEAVEVLAVYPHAHYLGKRLEGWATLPDGTRKDLVLIDDWDIDRQSIYYYKTPLLLPAGSVLHMRFVYDNSAANPHNPHVPPVRVENGNRSEDEMGHLWLQVLPVDATAQDDKRAPLLAMWMENRLRKTPNDSIALFNLGSLAMQQGDLVQAVARLQAAVAVKPHDARMLTALGSAQAGAGDTEAARTAFTQAIAAEPTSFDAHFDRASLEAAAGDTGAAIADLEAAVAANPADAEAHRGLAALYAANGLIDAAIVEARTVVKLAPQGADDWSNLGVFEARKGDTGAARGAFARALAADPANAVARRNLALLDGATP